MSTASTSATVTDEFPFRRVPEHTTAAWAEHDADAFASIFTADTNVVIGGNYLVGRAAVRAFMTAAFAGAFKGSRVVSDAVYLKRLDDEYALLVTVGGVMLPGDQEILPQRAIRATWLLAKRGEEWQIHAYHSSPIAQS